MTTETVNAPTNMEEAYKMLYRREIKDETPQITNNYLLWLKGEKEKK